MRIGLIADTHVPGSIRELWPQVFESLNGVDCILHAGDLHTLDLVDQLSELAPVYVARGNGDRGLQDDRLQDSWHLDFEGISVGMVHSFPTLENKSSDVLVRKLDKLFPENHPDVVIYGHTHKESIETVAGVLCVNPGSPTLPLNMSTRLGTIGYLDIGDGHFTASIFQLTERGIEAHKTLIPASKKIRTKLLVR